MYRIGRVESITYNSGRVERIKRVTRHPLTEEDRAEISAYLAKFPNPNHLSFAELLEEAYNNLEQPQHNKEMNDDKFTLNCIRENLKLSFWRFELWIKNLKT